MAAKSSLGEDDSTDAVREERRIGRGKDRRQPTPVGGAVDGGDPEPGQVVSTPLHIDQAGMLVVKPMNQRNNGCLRRVGDVMKLGLSGEQPPDAQSIEPTDEDPIEPGLHTVGPSKFVQAPVGDLDAVINPSVRPSRIGAPSHHLLKGGVDTKLEATQ